MLKIGVEVKFDFTYCVVCSGTVKQRTKDYTSDPSVPRLRVSKPPSIMSRVSGLKEKLMPNLLRPDCQLERRLQERRSLPPPRPSGAQNFSRRLQFMEMLEAQAAPFGGLMDASAKQFLGVDVQKEKEQFLSKVDALIYGQDPKEDKDEVTPAAEKPKLAIAMAAFMESLDSLNLNVTIQGALEDLPVPANLVEPIWKLTVSSMELAEELAPILQEAASRYQPAVIKLSELVTFTTGALKQASAPEGTQAILDAAVGTSELATGCSSLVQVLVGEPSINSETAQVEDSVLSSVRSVQKAAGAFEAVVVGHWKSAALFSPTRMGEWIKSFRGVSQAAGSRIGVAAVPQPPWQTVSTRLFEAASTVDRALRRMQEYVWPGSAKLGHVLPIDPCTERAAYGDDDAAFSAIVRAALHAHGGDVDSMCCEVKEALMDVVREVGAESFAALESVLSAASSRSWAKAAAKLKQGSFCATDVSRCEHLAGIIEAGCAVEVDHWWELPTLGRLGVQDAHFGSVRAWANPH